MPNFTLKNLAEGVQALSVLSPARLSIHQAAIFLRIAASEKTLTLGEATQGLGLVQAGRSHVVFLEPTRRDPDGLGWIRLIPDEDDLRVKHVVLTEAGRKVAKGLIG